MIEPAAVRATERHRGGDQHPERQEFRRRRDVHHRRTQAHADDVGGGGEGDGGRRERSRADDVRHRIDAERPQQVLAEHDRDAAERRRPEDDELRPAEQKRGAASPAFAKVGVEAARLRQRRRQFRERERAAERDEPAGDPDARSWPPGSTRVARRRPAIGKCRNRS